MTNSRSVFLAAGAMLAAALLPGCGPRTEAAPGPLTLDITPSAHEPGRIAAVLSGPAVDLLRQRERQGDHGRREVEHLFYLAVSGGTKSSRVPVPVPVLASRRYEKTRCVLVPSVSLTRGLQYEVVFEGPKLSPSLPRLTRTYSVPQDDRPSGSKVTGVYPGGRVPANLLKLYVHFSLPMGEGRAFEFIRLLDAERKPIKQAFHEIELWSEDHRRLTLLVNPGRTKRALGLSERMGPVLREHRRYTLEIGAGLPDQRGYPLGGPVHHAFETAGFDREQPRISSWQVEPPAAGSREPLRVDFGEPLDRALAERTIEVIGRDGAEVNGEVAMDQEARHWRLTPGQPWQPGRYVLAAAGELEDLAGNNLQRPFESAPEDKTRPAVNAPQFRRSFVLR